VAVRILILLTMPLELPVAVSMHLAGQVVLPRLLADILVRWITNLFD
jgi:hypothetical protein